MEGFDNAKIYLRYDREKKEFDFKIMVEDKVMGEKTFPESEVDSVRSSMVDNRMKDLFDLLVTEARKDPEGRFVSPENVTLPVDEKA